MAKLIIKILLNIFLFLLGGLGIFLLVSDNVETGLMLVIMAILFHVLSKLVDMQESISEITRPEIPKQVKPVIKPVAEIVPKSIQEPEITQPPKPEAEPEPATEVFKCKKCGKEFSELKKLQRHVGMAHYKDLEV